MINIFHDFRPSGKIGLINKSDHLFKNFSREIIKKKPILKIY